MLDEKKIFQLEATLQRIFTLPVTRSTFRELQTGLALIVGNDKDKINDLYEALFVGTPKSGLLPTSEGVQQHFREVVRQFSIPIRISKEVFERGEFISIITSDALSQNNTVVFLNRLRRIDGDEFLFISDAESSTKLLEHFLGRLYELGQSKQDVQQLACAKEGLLRAKKQIDALLEQI